MAAVGACTALEVVMSHILHMVLARSLRKVVGCGCMVEGCGRMVEATLEQAQQPDVNSTA